MFPRNYFLLSKKEERGKIKERKEKKSIDPYGFADERRYSKCTSA